MKTLNLTEQEISVIITAIQMADPTWMFAWVLTKKILEQANPQPEVKEVES